MTRPTQSSGNLESLSMQVAEQRETSVQLRESIDEVRLTMTELEQRLDVKFEAILRKLDKRPMEETSLPSNPITLSQDPQVHFSNTEPGRSFRESRDSLIKKVELLTFSGEDVYGWIALAERFFRIGGYGELMKIELVSVTLGGDVLSWFNSDILRHQFSSWCDFKNKLIERFSRVKLCDPSQPFFAVQQTGTIAEYIHKLEDLSTQVVGLTDTQKEGIFINGLTPEMREVVTMCKPVNLPDMISTAYQMEDSSLFSVIQKEMKSRNMATLRPPENKSKSYSNFNTNTGWKQAAQPLQPVTTQKQWRQPTKPLPQLRLS